MLAANGLSKPFADGKSTGDSRFSGARGCSHLDGTKSVSYTHLMDWHFQEAQQKVEIARHAGIPVWIMEPLRGGKLAKASKEMEAELKAMRPDESIPGWAFRFLQSIPGVTMVLSGMSSLEQLKDNIETWQTDAPLSPEEFDTVVKLADEEVRRGGLPCTACHYCTSHCPQKLPIPEPVSYTHLDVYKRQGYGIPEVQVLLCRCVVKDIIEHKVLPAPVGDIRYHTVQ